jgi:hypothetical protein
MGEMFVWIFVAFAAAVFVCMLYDNLKCNHEWKQVHDTKYDNIGFRDKYPVVLVCTKCGKVKVLK